MAPKVVENKKLTFSNDVMIVMTSVTEALKAKGLI